MLSFFLVGAYLASGRPVNDGTLHRIRGFEIFIDRYQRSFFHFAGAGQLKVTTASKSDH